MQRTGVTIPFLLLVQEKGGKRTTQEGEDFDFFPLLTPLIETMKEGDTPSFDSPRHCADLRDTRQRRTFPQGLQPQPLFPCGGRESEDAIICMRRRTNHAFWGCRPSFPWRAGRRGRRPLHAQSAGSRFQGRRLPHLRGGLFGGRILTDLYNGGEI